MEQNISSELQKYIEDKKNILTNAEKDIVMQGELVKMEVILREKRNEIQEDMQIRQRVESDICKYNIKNEILDLEIQTTKNHLNLLNNKKRKLSDDYKNICPHKYIKPEHVSHIHNGVVCCVYCKKGYDKCKCNICSRVCACGNNNCGKSGY